MMKAYLLLCVMALPILFTGVACGHPPHGKTVIVRHGEHRGAWLGVAIESVTAKLADRKQLNTREGCYVKDVAAESPAEKAGIREGDVIVEVEGKKIRDADDLITTMRKTDPGKTLVIGVLRGTTKESFTVETDSAPRMRAFTIPRPPRHVPAPRVEVLRGASIHGLSLEELNAQLGEYFGAPDGEGLLVKRVASGTKADKAGFKAGDVIVKVGGTSVANLRDLRRAIRDLNDGEKVDVHVLRRGTNVTLSLEVDRQRDLSDFDQNIIIDLFSEEEGKEFRRDMERLQEDLRDMQLELRENLHDLEESLENELRTIEISIRI